LDEGCDSLFITAPESLCWFLNIRGSDVQYTPIVLASLLVSNKGQVILFIDQQKMNEETLKHLGDNVVIAPERALVDQFSEWFGHASRMAVDETTVSEWHIDFFRSKGLELKITKDPCALPKACKNEVELNGIRAAHLRDGVALTSFLAWFSHAVELGNLTEMVAAERLENFRKRDTKFLGLSFPTIAGFEKNGAVIHYRPTADSSAMIAGDSLFLLDSGGQYADGTTDVTRTLLVGSPHPEHILRFTQVLKGHIALASVRFPVGTAGGQLDALARVTLWNDGVDYDHGTGHGVGAFLNVHEGPQRISKGSMGPSLRAGMVVSNEPGYYKSGEFGIRIENLLAVVPASKNGEKSKFLEFETLTLAPLERRLIDRDLLTNTEKVWLDCYHQRVYNSMSSELDSETLSWLKSATLPI
jgi:Xaa-Pro aminopeptidase